MEGWIARVPLMADGYHRKMLDKVDKIRRSKTVYPPPGKEFYALSMTPFDAVKAVIVGQDPYHGPGQANGLAFSVPDEISAPPSLRNIFKEVREDVYKDSSLPFSTDLTRWAEQGVLLLNTILTVQDGDAGSHTDLGWQKLTDAIIQALADQREHLVFLLWGKKAQAKRSLIAENQHLILEAPHPSPLSAWRGFFGCRHFSAANAYLQEHGKTPIVW
jgi:uracil-DNA glycosylase